MSFKSIRTMSSPFLSSREFTISRASSSAFRFHLSCVFSMVQKIILCTLNRWVGVHFCTGGWSLLWQSRYCQVELYPTLFVFFASQRVQCSGGRAPKLGVGRRAFLLFHSLGGLCLLRYFFAGRLDLLGRGFLPIVYVPSSSLGKSRGR